MKLPLHVGLLILVSQVSWIPPGTARFHKDTTIFQQLSNSSYFGFSATYQPHIQKLIISAPKADNIGKIFDCNITTTDCSEIAFKIDRKAPSKYTHNYWLGATVKAGPNYFLTCAPLSVDSIGKNKDGAVSTCFIVTPREAIVFPVLSEFDRKRNTQASDNYFEEQKMLTFGWSIDITKNNYYHFGGPGMFSGRTMIVNPAKQMSPQALIGKAYNINFNFGYSVASGNFNSRKECYAVGTPYGKIGHGMVEIFKSSNLDLDDEVLEPTKLSGVQYVGSMFGAVLCSARLVGSTDTLFIGAPTLSEGHDYNVGAVYVYAKTYYTLKKLSMVRVIQGSKIGGQFGSAIANIGDINGDKINDIAISAPYENDGTGAVYLYCGASIADKNIVNLAPLQKFAPSDVTNFGLSLAVLSDYDENGCNELAVGAPGSGKVLLYYCIPEIPITLEVRVPPLKTRKDKTRFTFAACFTVTYPPKLKRVIGNVQINLEIKHERAVLADRDKDGEYIVPLNIQDTIHCRDVTVLTPAGGNYNQEITYQMTAKLVENAETLSYNRFHVMFSDRSKLVKKGSVRAAECSNDNECIPKLSVTVKFSESLTSKTYTIGSSSMETFSLTVSNDGDTAYEMCLKGHLEGAEIYDTPLDCLNTEEQVTCKPQQALHQNNSWTLQPFTMRMDKLTSDNKDLTLHVQLFDDCDNPPQHRNKSFSIPLAQSTDFAIKGNTDIDNTVNMTKDEIRFLGKRISHIYTIKNNGVTTWVGLYYTLTFKKDYHIDPLVESSYVSYAATFATDCNIISSNNDEAKVRCHINILPGLSPKQIIVPIYILSGKLESLLDGGNESVITHCSFEFDKRSISASITTNLTQRTASVPMWIILAACFVGILIVLLFILILVECGCMRRKNKQMLKALKKDVRRQTIRRSMRVTEERQKLVEEPEENEPTCSINHPEDPTKEVTFHQNTAKESDFPTNITKDNEQKPNPMLKELNERLNKQK